jgi:hypothetical protein
MKPPFMTIKNVARSLNGQTAISRATVNFREFPSRKIEDTTSSSMRKLPQAGAIQKTECLEHVVRKEDIVNAA